uniref:Phycobiliprotein ApcE n=1 Tax=Hildenbrandia rivularis TaxID=135206 RepID=A0A1C9CFE3_9FLOR|nr:phycobilisome core-membrane linker protein [Hildenbrandia rivularis]AOM67087.1 phycobilisome core-membrane linker protein [Hildenbrandia rivularis]
MSVKASGGSPTVKPQPYRTTLFATIMQAEQQDRFLNLGELGQLITFLNSGKKRLKIADILTQNANSLVAQAADKIFTGGSAISYLEKPQAAILVFNNQDNNNTRGNINRELSKNATGNSIQSLTSLFSGSDATPTGFKPIDITKYGSMRMKKSLRDLDWFLRYLTYAIVAGDTNILLVNIRGLRELIDNACSSVVTVVALKSMRRNASKIFSYSIEDQAFILEYFDVLIKEFESFSYTDKLKKRSYNYLQGLRLPQIYAQAGNLVPRFVMKAGLSESEKNLVIKACYRQIFERDIEKAYSLSFVDLESQLKNGKLSAKEFVRNLGLSVIYRKQFFEPFVNSRALELAFRHFLGRGPGSLEEFRVFFAILSDQGLPGLINSLINLDEYTNYFGEETVPYIRNLGEEAQECKNWGPQIALLSYSAPSKKAPEFITLFGSYNQPLPDQHPYGKGNDPSNIQFGAIFPQSRRDVDSYPAPFGKYTRRVLIRRGPGIYNQINNPSFRSRCLGLLGPRVFELDPRFRYISSNIKSDSTAASLTSINSIINVIYLRVFGRFVYSEERLLLKLLESKFENQQISVREFVRQLSKSSVFRSLYWQPLYICKAIEYIHRRLIGRPTYGRQEINQYFDIAYKQGYYKVIDAMIDSLEYIEAFGDNIVPYDRYTTSSGIILPSFILKKNIPQISSNMIERFISLGKAANNISTQSINSKVEQGVSKRRYQSTIFTVNKHSSLLDLQKSFRACFRQIFERDLYSIGIGHELTSIKQQFISQRITVKQLVLSLGMHDLYQKEFYQPYSNTKVIELGTKHFLGRAPNNQLEVRYYNQILASQGLREFIKSLVYSVEYATIFGDNIIPYRRFPSLPATNFSNTQSLYNVFTNKNNRIVT